MIAWAIFIAVILFVNVAWALIASFASREDSTQAEDIE
jgi:hypothetical protein